VGKAVQPGSEEAHALLVRECLEELALMGFAAWENQRRAVQVNGRWVSLSKSGRGDIHMILPKLIDGKVLGVHGEVECKTGQSTQAAKQRAHMRLVRSSGGIYLVARHRKEMRAEIERLGFQARL
jgi:hypothetical protein